VLLRLGRRFALDVLKILRHRIAHIEQPGKNLLNSMLPRPASYYPTSGGRQPALDHLVALHHHTALAARGRVGELFDGVVIGVVAVKTFVVTLAYHEPANPMVGRLHLLQLLL
jgi:hypothetical protein